MYGNNKYICLAGSPRGSGVKVNPVLQSSSENRPSLLRTNPEQSLDSQFSTQGSARTFNPQENPLAQRTRPRVQQLLEETKLTGNENKQLSHVSILNVFDLNSRFL